jgi:hypothetical protein
LTIKSEIRDKVIQMSQQEKKGRNQISYELNLSQGSVSNILKEWRESKDQTASLSQINSTISTNIPLNTNVSSSLLNESYIDSADTPYQESYPTVEVSQQPEEHIKHIHDLEATKDLLQKQIEERKVILEANQKAAADFLTVKEEMAKCGIEDGSVVIQTFRKHGHDPSKISNLFLEIQDVVIEKERIKRLKEETNHKLRVLHTKLEQIGLGDFESLRRVVVAIMTLETYGIGVEQIISYYHNQHARVVTNYRGNRVPT